MIHIVKIETNNINDWDSFHRLFKEKFGFPDFYGENMNAWIDCMSYIDDKEAGMSEYIINPGDTLLLDLVDFENFKLRCLDQYLALIECASFVNRRRIDSNDKTIIAILM